METCYRHPNRETGVSCSNCGRPICPDCMTPTSVGMRCPECSREKTQVRTIHSVGGGATTVTMALLIVNIFAFVASGQFSVGGSTSNELFRNGALFGPAIDINHDYWRLVTSGFLHSGFIHVGFNMYLLWVLGQMLEPEIGSIRFAAIYFVALLGGAFGALLVTPTAYTVGASGAVFGLMAAAFVELRARGIDPFQAGIGWLIVINLAFSFVISNISVGGHIGGLAAGALAALALHQGDRVRNRVLGLGLCAVLALVAVAGAIAAAGQTAGIGG
jgi:membrane associated rhomboid family serine protease